MSGSSTMTSRRHPLSTCAASTITLSHGLYKRILELNGPIGAITSKPLAKLSSIASPIVSVVLFNWLAVLAFVDDHILLIEKMVETHFPSSSHVFNTVDVMVNKIEDFPKEIDGLAIDFPFIIHKIPFLDLMVGYAIKLLEFITSVLVGWGLDSSAKEKEIRVDDMILKDNNLSYKEALEKVAKLKLDKYIDEDDVKDIGAKDYNQEKDVGNWNEEITKDAQIMRDFTGTNEDPLLELFEFGWEAPKTTKTMPTPPVLSRTNSQMSRSSSQMRLSN